MKAHTFSPRTVERLVGPTFAMGIARAELQGDALILTVASVEWLISGLLKERELLDAVRARLDRDGVKVFIAGIRWALAPEAPR